jgi:mono/diheme cytochrome c family protein
VRRASLLLLLLGAVALALFAAGCGPGTQATATPETVVGEVPTAEEPSTEDLPALALDGDATAGKDVYASAGCGGCHVLSDAGSSGTVGPNLDDSQPSLQLVVDRVTNGQGGMPAFSKANGGSLEDQQIADVSAYVVQATGG